jgi:hypothetical protein
MSAQAPLLRRPSLLFFFPLALCLSLALAAGCNGRRAGEEEDPLGGMDGGGGNDPPGTLTLTPDQADIVLSGGMDQVVNFRATSKQHGDVTTRATWTLSSTSVGAVQAGRVQVRGALEMGGAYTVTANYRNQTGSALLRVRVNLADVMDSSAPADARDYFSGGGGGPAPSIVYPFNDTMMAPNVLQVRLQWQAGSGQQVFRITAAGPTYKRTHYVGASRCPGGRCTYDVDDKVWGGMGHSALNQAVTITIDGSSGKGAQIGSSAPITVRFSPEDIKGGLYYFSPTIRGIKRVPLGASKPVDFITNGAETGCAGCHAVTRDGKKVAVEFGSGQTRVGSTVVDGSDPSKRNFPLRNSIAWNFSWFNPDGTRLITNWSGALTLRDPQNGQALGEITRAQMGSSYGGAMPEWSPDGKWIAFVRYLQNSSYDFELVNSGDIAVVPYNNGAFGDAITIVKGTPNSEVHIWPSWTPDSKWLVFNSQECGGSACQQYNAVRTRLRLIRVVDDAGQLTVGQQPIELLAGTHTKHQNNNWPKVAPFLQNGSIVFVVYSANYGWGFTSGGRPQLYMFGLDLSKAKTGVDPSYQPIWLPFQEANTGNHSAIWTTDVACVTDKDCPAEFQCSMGSCVPRIG